MGNIVQKFINLIDGRLKPQIGYFMESHCDGLQSEMTGGEFTFSHICSNADGTEYTVLKASFVFEKYERGAG